MPMMPTLYWNETEGWMGEKTYSDVVEQIELARAAKKQGSIYSAPVKGFYIDYERPSWKSYTPFTGDSLIFWRGFSGMTSELASWGWKWTVEHNRFTGLNRLVGNYCEGAMYIRSVWLKDISKEKEIVLLDVSIGNQYRKLIKTQDPAILDKNWYTDLDKISTDKLLEIVAKRLESEVPVIEEQEEITEETTAKVLKLIRSA